MKQKMGAIKMEFLARYYDTLLGFMGNHPVFCFFTFPIWAGALFLPVLFVAGILDEIHAFFVWVGKKLF